LTEVAELRLESFVPRIGERFGMALDAPWNLELVLAEATALSGATAPPGAFRAPFRLTFCGPAEPVRTQSIVPLENDALGRLEIFVVPIGPDANGMRYEAIFT
jgi:hypothetical protein